MLFFKLMGIENWRTLKRQWGSLLSGVQKRYLYLCFIFRNLLRCEKKSKKLTATFLMIRNVFLNLQLKKKKSLIWILAFIIFSLSHWQMLLTAHKHEWERVINFRCNKNIRKRGASDQTVLSLTGVFWFPFAFPFLRFVKLPNKSDLNLCALVCWRLLPRADGKHLSPP